MSRLYSHINTAKAALNLYKGDLPFNIFLKKFFTQEKKYGSSDRKTISSLCYSYFRLGKALSQEHIESKILTAYFLSNTFTKEWPQFEKLEWNAATEKPLEEKLQLAKFEVETIFPFNNELSPSIDIIAFNTSLLIQPGLFIRIRPGKQFSVKKKLLKSEVPFKEINENCFVFANATKLATIIEINKEAVIQDLNSQRVGDFMKMAELKTSSEVWDCCAASGGKSIMCYDLLENIKLSVSDVRESIMHNLQNRFSEAGIKDYKSFVCDITNAKSLSASLAKATFDLIICDAPCSGSGTWSRTPEQLLFFKEEDITKYSILQKSIVQNAIVHVKKGGYFLYITCSVFAKENEEVVMFIQKKYGHLTLVKMQLLKGYEIRADSMFVALFKS